ncbi:MAG: NnrS family protein [Campylobacterota bacterium]|nr:NnrS family protein [Campylobacterota bacterium]
MKESYFFSQTHQPFFVLAFVNAIVTMLLFMLSFKGILTLTITPSSFHAYSLIFFVFTPAFLAFLFTTFPRFSGMPAIEKALYLKVFGLFAIGTILLLIGAVVSLLVYKLGMLVLFVGHAWAIKILMDIFRSSGTRDKHDTFWILLAMGFGLLSHLLFVAAEFTGLPLYNLPVQVGIYLYLFLVAFSVAQRMVPLFSHCNVVKNTSFLKVVLLLLILHVILEALHPHLSFIADFILAYITAKELFRWNLPFPNPNPLLWILHLSLYWVPVAFLFGGMSNVVSLINGTPFLFLDIHTLMLGFVFTILIGFGTRVTIGHSGNIMQADRWVILLFNWTQLVVVLRLLTSMASAWGWNFMILFDISVTVWLILFILWAVRFFPLLIKGKKLP